MECMHCGASWTLGNGQTKLANCPFCGKALLIEKTEERYTDLAGALKAIAEMKGKEILISKPQAVLGIFLDIASDLKKEFRLLKLFYDNKTADFFADSTKGTEGQLNMAVRSLQENVFMEAESARHIVNVFAMVLGMKDQVQEVKELPEEQSVPPKYDVEVEKEEITFSEIASSYFNRGRFIELDQELYEVHDIGMRILGIRPDPNISITLRNVKEHDLIEKSFPRDGKCRLAEYKSRKMQYLHSESGYHSFMDPETHNILELNDSQVDGKVRYLTANDMVEIGIYRGSVHFTIPPAVNRKVIETMETGDERSKKKYATIETGEVIEVPMEIRAGDRIRMYTKTKQYWYKL